MVVVVVVLEEGAGAAASSGTEEVGDAAAYTALYSSDLNNRNPKNLL